MSEVLGVFRILEVMVTSVLKIQPVQLDGAVEDV
jgi:hypothetical protein